VRDVSALRQVLMHRFSDGYTGDWKVC